MKEPIYTLQRGRTPLLVSVPHAGTHLPADIAAALQPRALQVEDTDWFVDRLYAFGATGFPFTKTALLLDSHSEGVYDAAIAMYKSTCAYCKWEDQGIITISGMTERDSMASSPKLEEVRELARKLA